MKKLLEFGYEKENILFLDCPKKGELTNRPTIYMKELYVNEKYRGQKVGEQLMNALRNEAEANNCTQIKWTVAPWNEAGQRFYERLGANENKDWLNYEWNI